MAAALELPGAWEEGGASCAARRASGGVAHSPVLGEAVAGRVELCLAKEGR